MYAHSHVPYNWHPLQLCTHSFPCGHTFTNIVYVVEQQLDGNAIAFGIASSPGPDWLRDVISTLGTRLKAHQALRSLFEDEVS